MTTENGAQTPNGDDPATFHLASAVIDGTPTVVAAVGPRCVALRDIVDAGTAVPDQLHELLADWERWRAVIAHAVGTIDDSTPTRNPRGWLVPVQPAKLVCVGVNYH